MEKFFKSNFVRFLGIVPVFGLFCLRFVNLTTLPIFADEAIYVRWSQVMKAEETLRFLPLSDGKQPLYMWVVIPFLKIISDPLIAGRMVSVLCGLGTLAGVSLLTYLLFKKINLALAAGFIYAISPFTFFFDRMALADAMLSMFGVWVFIFAYLAVTKVRLDYAMLSGFALGGAWLTKSPALFFALMLPLILVFSERKNIFKSAFYILVAIVMGYGFYNILRLGPNYSMISSRNLDYVYPVNHFFTSPFDPFKPWILQVWQWLVDMGPWPLIGMAVFGIVFNFRNHWREILVLMIWCFGPIIVESEFAKVLTARYVLFSIPYLIVIAATSFAITEKWLREFVIIFFVIFIAKSLIFDYFLLFKPESANLPRSERSGYLEEWTAGQGIRESAKFFIDQYNSNSSVKIIIGTEGYFGTLPDGLQIYLNKYPQITVIGTGLNFSETPKPLKESQDYGNRTFLLINNDRFKGDYTKLGYTLIASYPKAPRPDGSFQSLLLFELPKTAD